MNLPGVFILFLCGICQITIISSQDSDNSPGLKCYACISEGLCTTDNVAIQQCDPLADLLCVSSNLTFQSPSSEETATITSSGCLSSEVKFTPPTRNGCIDGPTYLNLLVPNPPSRITLPTVLGQVCFCDSDLCNTQNILPVTPRNCPDGLPPVSCDVDPCEKAECPLNPHAFCIPNYCNRRQHCLAEWFNGDRTRVDCGICPDGLPSFQCYVDPCYQAECTSIPDAVCIGNYCNRQQPCLAEWFNVSGYPLDCGVDHCAFICDDKFAAVCGSDIQTYGNACELSRAACRDPTIIQVYTGECTVKAALFNGRYNRDTRSGYVELSENAMDWHMLCYDGIQDSRFHRVASVVCKDLGYGPPGIEFINTLGFIFSGPFVSFNDAWCDVDATEVLNCSLEGSFSTHLEMCIGKVLQVACLPAEAEEYEVALLVYSTSYMEGVVLIYINGQWGPICGGHQAGDTVCRALGLGPQHDSFLGHITPYAPPVLGFLHCDDNHNGTVRECSLFPVNDYWCNGGKFLTVSCQEADDSHDYDLPSENDGFPSEYDGIPSEYESENEFSSEDYRYPEDDVYSDDDFDGGSSQADHVMFFPFLFLVVIAIIVIGVTCMAVYTRFKAQQIDQNPVGTTSVPSLSNRAFQLHSDLSGGSRNGYSSHSQEQALRSVTFSLPRSSETQEVDGTHTYPLTSFQSSGNAHDSPPPYDDFELPKYEEVVMGQIPQRL